MEIKTTRIKHIKSGKELKNNKEFLQSYYWGRFQEDFGRKSWIIDSGENSLLVIKHKLFSGLSYLYCPRGILNKEFLIKVAELSKKEHCSFLRIDPKENITNLKEQYRFIKSKPDQPQDCWILNIEKSEQEFLKEMKSKTRYNIRLAQKKDVKIIKSKNINDINIFYKLSSTTAKRQKIRIHPKEHYKELFQVFSEKNMAYLYLAKFNNEVLAVNMLIFYGNTATYLHGSTSNKHRNLMAPYLLQWQAILDAKQKGLEYYDFGGVSPEGAEGHSWEGVTKFKTGFGGYRIRYPDSYHIIFNQLGYKFYKFMKSTKQLIR